MAAYVFGLSPHFTAASVASAASGGLLLGCAVAFKTGVLSGVLGISTYCKRCIMDVQGFRYAFVLGMVTAGTALGASFGGAYPLAKSAEVSLRMVLGGFLVGFGAAMQGGCTSGHGLTGLGRLSVRSLVAVPLFMAAGVATGTLSKSARAFPSLPDVEGAAPDLLRGSAVLGLCGGLLLASAAAAGAKDWSGSAALRTALELVVGLCFGAGLFVSGMARPNKVAGFLDLGSGAWDGSLAFVMGGALMVTFPFFQWLARHGSKPTLADSYDLPGTSGKVDWRLLTGAVLFGVGWGTCGMCPGPALVSLGAAPSVEVHAAVASMLAGIWTWESVRRHLDAAPAKTHSS